MVKIKAVSYLAEMFGFQEKEIKLEKPTAVKELIPKIDLSTEHIIVVVNHKSASLETLVKDDDYVQILPVVDGGSV